jgi:hypothetical protein
MRDKTNAPAKPLFYQHGLALSISSSSMAKYFATVPLSFATSLRHFNYNITDFIIRNYDYCLR